MSETTAIYIPRYNLKAGFTAVEVEQHRGGFYRAGSTSFFDLFSSHDEGKKWFRTKEAALSKAEDERLKRIASLEKTVAKLKSCGPFVAKEG